MVAKTTRRGKARARATVSPRQTDLVWATPRQALLLILRGATFHPAGRVALVVGTLLTLANQGTVLLGGHLGPLTVLRVLTNYVVPYVVSSLGYLASFRRR